MPKTDSRTPLDGYTSVAARIALFWQKYPRGRIITELHDRTDKETIFSAAVYRDAADAHPAATGWAAEREGDGDINLVACLENTETSAVGRALANLGLTGSTNLRPSAEEMIKASRARARAAREAPHEPPKITVMPIRGAGDVYEAPQVRPAVEDFVRLIREAEAEGFVRPARARAWRQSIPSLSDGMLVLLERRLRAYCKRSEG
jgi:hypothetical protein